MKTRNTLRVVKWVLLNLATALMCRPRAHHCINTWQITYPGGDYAINGVSFKDLTKDGLKKQVRKKSVTSLQFRSVRRDRLLSFGAYHCCEWWQAVALIRALISFTETLPTLPDERYIAVHHTILSTQTKVIRAEPRKPL